MMDRDLLKDIYAVAFTAMHGDERAKHKALVLIQNMVAAFAEEHSLDIMLDWDEVQHRIFAVEVNHGPVTVPEPEQRFGHGGYL